ncbi:MAG: glycosyltransferase [Elainellaceae cyanobacterium]
MKILFLSPQPFYQDRGTPIAIHMILKVLSARRNRVDVITYPEGKDICIENVKVYRTPALPFVRNIRPGFSWKKVVCDVFVLIYAFRLASQRRYHLIHAVEESVFIALLLKVFFKIPYVYDMDSSLPQQMIEKYSLLSPLLPILNFFEGLAIKNAKVTVPVCETLATEVRRRYGATKIVLLPDVSLV